MAHGDSKQFMRAKITALRRARRLIANYETSFICWALENVRRNTRDRAIKDAVAGLMGYIDRQLEGSSVLDVWITTHRPKMAPHRSYGDYSTIMRDYRVQWIDWMIGDLKAQLAARRK